MALFGKREKAYEVWGDRREALEDQADDLMDQLDELDS